MPSDPPLPRGRARARRLAQACCLAVSVAGCDGGEAPADAHLAERRDTGPSADATSDTPPDARSAGCGLAPPDALGGIQRTSTFSGAAGGERSYYLVVPSDYDPTLPHRVIMGFAGTSWTGEMIRPYLDLEQPGSRTIYVYPDPLFRDFEGWGNLGGWLLGPHATPADGMEDLTFVSELLDGLEASYCIDRDRVFATGHSWGGDMAAVVGCFLGDRFRAVAPVAANRPYWFEPAGGGEPGCLGEIAVWTFFGQADDHFTSQPSVGAYGIEQDDFWRTQNDCGAAATDLGFGLDGECVEHALCREPTRFCLYGPETGHQRPGYYPTAVRTWFGSF
jgi:polyhydroxybutyrate depolymerase